MILNKRISGGMSRILRDQKVSGRRAAPKDILGGLGLFIGLIALAILMMSL